MKRSLFIFSIIFAGILNAAGALTADWKLHMPFDRWQTSIVETPTRVYFMVRTFESGYPVERRVKSHSLFYYDKAGDEIISINARTTANGNAVACIGYNIAKKYLLVAYTDCSIDFLYDDGKIYNVQSLKATTISAKKEINSINFDPDRNLAYVATSFGYITLNDTKHEVAESRIYDKDISSIARCGENVVLSSDGTLYFAKASEARYNFSDYTPIPDLTPMSVVLPLKGNDFAAYTGFSSGYLGILKWNGTNYVWNQASEDPQFFCNQTTANGHRLSGNVLVYDISNDGTVTSFARPNEVWRFPATSLNGSELWILENMYGIKSYKTSGNNQWTVTRDFMAPNAPATYISTSLCYHPKYGMLAGSNGVDMALMDFSQRTPSQVSGLKGGFWSEYSPLYTNPTRLKDFTNYYGIAVDPQNTDYVYRASVTGGLVRLNLTNPDDILILGSPSNANASDKGFVKVAENMVAWDVVCQFSTPRFSADGTMWTAYYDMDKGTAELWYWTATDRAASKDAASFRPLKKFTLPEFKGGNRDVITTLTRNPNIIIIGGMSQYGTILVYDHRGTLDNTSDDRYVFIEDPYDQDGGSVAFQGINNLVEDPATGLVWITAMRGLFTLNPATIFDNPKIINRIKVARNDGTNLADYLLNEINVTGMCIDGEGRKWFTTSNGLVCTTNDGRSILGEFTMENSYLPGVTVYTAAYNPENNSLMVATEGGLVEMFPSGSGGSAAADSSSFRVYPNPVEPDYYGWVRIDNVADGSLVKITDARGGIVKELGPVSGGSVEWDVSGLNNTRVSTGVYYIMVSPPSSGGNTQISKILVLN